MSLFLKRWLEDMFPWGMLEESSLLLVIFQGVGYHLADFVGQ